MIIIATTPPQAPPITAPFSDSEQGFVPSSFSAKRQKHFNYLPKPTLANVKPMLISGNETVIGLIG